MTRERFEGLVQVLILLLIASMAGAASFTHVHDWTMHNSPHHTPEWFGWANAVISELTPTAAGLEIRRRKRHHQPTTYPMTVLIAAAIVSIAAQVAQAKPGPTGYLLSALPALAFLALTKLLLTRTSATTPASAGGHDLDSPAATVTITPDRPALPHHHTESDTTSAPNPAPALDHQQLPAELVFQARMAANSHHRQHQAPITPATLAQHLGISDETAAHLLAHLATEVSA